MDDDRGQPVRRHRAGRSRADAREATGQLKQEDRPWERRGSRRSTCPTSACPRSVRRCRRDRYAERLAALRERADAAGFDRLVVYADREHSANLAFLSGFDPRFEEAMLVVGPAGDPLILVGNECYGMAGASPLAMRREHFQDFSLPSQPRDRSRPLRDILAGEGIGPGSRVGVLGWKTYADPARIEIPAFIVDELRGLVGGTRLGPQRERPAHRSRRRPADHQRRRPAGGVRARLVPDLRRPAAAVRRPRARDDRGRGGPAAALERDAAVVPPDADRRPAGGARPAEPRRPADRARRAVHGRVRDLGRAHLPRRLAGRGRRRAAGGRPRLRRPPRRARTSRPSPSGTAPCTSARSAARSRRSSTAGWATRSSASGSTRATSSTSTSG